MCTRTLTHAHLTHAHLTHTHLTHMHTSHTHTPHMHTPHTHTSHTCTPQTRTPHTRTPHTHAHLTHAHVTHNQNWWSGPGSGGTKTLALTSSLLACFLTWTLPARTPHTRAHMYCTPSFCFRSVSGGDQRARLSRLERAQLPLHGAVSERGHAARLRLRMPRRVDGALLPDT